MTTSPARAASRIRLLTWDEDAVIAVARELRAETGGADIAFAWVSPGFRPHLKDFIEILQVEGHARCVAGCSADGIIGTDEEDEGVAGFSVMFLKLPDAVITPRLIDSTFTIPRDLPAGGCWIVLGNPGRFDAPLFLKDMNRLYPGVPVFGGMAGGGREADHIFHFLSGHAAEDAAGIAVHLAGVRAGGLVSQGCQPIGEPYTITKAEQDLVYAIGGRPAYEVLAEAFAGLDDGEKAAARGNIMAGLAATEYRDEFRQGDFLIRHITGGDPRSGALRIGALPRVGQTLQFQLRSRDAADADLRIRCREALEQHGPPLAFLLFSCGGRGRNLFEVPSHDAGIIAETFGPVPLAGFFAGGEFGPVGNASYVHGYTAAAAILYP